MAPVQVGDKVSSRATVQATKQKSNTLQESINLNPAQFRMLTGDRPTGRLHLGHYFGTLQNRVKLQNLGVDTMVLVADYQVITDRDSVGPIKERVLGLVTDYLACGIDPEKSTIFAHSAIPALNQLMIPFLSLVTESELHRNPTVRAELENTEERALSGLLLTYPVHQAADILFCKADVVPVGQDQLPHLELTQRVASRFNRRYGKVFRQPQALLSDTPLLLGIDGTKMSKSKGNAIEIAHTADETAKILRSAKTDVNRVITYEPVTRPEVANLLDLASLVTGESPEFLAVQLGDGGGGALKSLIIDAVNDFFAPIRQRREELALETSYVEGILKEGNEKANEMAEATLVQVREAMGMVY